jgi:hypothetical protein
LFEPEGDDRRGDAGAARDRPQGGSDGGEQQAAEARADDDGCRSESKLQQLSPAELEQLVAEVGVVDDACESWSTGSSSPYCSRNVSKLHLPP